MIDGIQEGKVLSSFLVYLLIITRKKWWWFLFYSSCQRESVLSHWSLKSWIGAKTFIFLYNLLTLSKSNHSLLVRETFQFQTPYNFPKKKKKDLRALKEIEQIQQQTLRTQLN